MKFDVDDIVTLDDGREYYLIDKNVVNGVVYFYSVLYDQDIDRMLEGEYCFFEVKDDILYKVEDEKMISQLMNLFLQKTVFRSSDSQESITFFFV